MQPHNDPAALFGKALEHHLQGRFADAIAFYDAVLRLNPNIAAAHSNRGLALQSLGRVDEALQSCDRAIRLQPDYADAHFNKAIALRRKERLDDAVRSYDAAIKFQPGHVEAWNNRGNVLRELKRTGEALQSFDRALALKPDYADAHYNRGNALQDLKRRQEAVQSYARAVALKPDFVQAHTNRGNVLRDLQCAEEALESYAQAIALRPNSPEAYTGRGNALKDQGRFEEALRCYDHAIGLDANFVDAYWNKSLCALVMGDFAQGWPLYEWRKMKFGSRVYSGRLWSGRESLVGKTLLIHAEQGFGDTIQFCRYARLVRDRGARVILAVQDPLVQLLKGLDPDIEIVGLSDTPPAFDYHTALLSLPLCFETTLESIPRSGSYLSPPPGFLLQPYDGLTVALAWAGNPDHANDHNRSLQLSDIRPLLALEGIRWLIVQMGADADALEPRDDIIILGDRLTDFSQTAAVVCAADLVISVDTALCHLAGALGRPVWTLLPHAPDWRWLVGRNDSPWYPTMTLFRQPKPGDWRSVLAAVEAQLAHMRHG